MGDYGRTSSVSNMLNTLQWDTLHQRRTRAQVLMFYKVVTSVVDIPVADYLIIRSSRNIDSLRDQSQEYIQLRARILAFQYSFFLYTPGGYLVERWVRGCAAQIGCFLASQVYQWPPFYLKIGLDIGRVFAKCIICNEFFLWFTYRLSKCTYVSQFTW